MKKKFTRSFWGLLPLLLFSFSLKAQTGNALLYDGIDDYLTMPTNIVSSLSGDFTIEAWVYWKGGQPWQRIFDFGNGSGPTGEYMYLAASSDAANNNQVMFAIKKPNLSEQRVTGAGGILPQNTWTHVAVTLVSSTNTATVYINGVVSGINASVTFRPSELNTSLSWLGHSQYFGSPYFDPNFNGAIDEFRISNTVRYPAGGFTPATSFTADANTVALYHFEEGAPSQTTVPVDGTNAPIPAMTATLGSTLGVDANDPSWRIAATLPVYILQFDAHKTGKAVVLNWKVFSTGEGGQFVIERSTDGNNFQPIGTKSIPATQGTFSYSFEDYSYNSGKNYYRLKVMENYAPVKYSSIVSVEGEVLLTAYPTITSSQIYIRIPQATTITIYSSSGLLMKKMKLASSQNIDVSRFSKGSYQIFFEGSNETVRFVKL